MGVGVGVFFIKIFGVCITPSFDRVFSKSGNNKWVHPLKYSPNLNFNNRSVGNYFGVANNILL